MTWRWAQRPALRAAHRRNDGRDRARADFQDVGFYQRQQSTRRANPRNQLEDALQPIGPLPGEGPRSGERVVAPRQLNIETEQCAESPIWICSKK